MQELTNKNFLFKLAFIYSLLIIILICIPSYFYTQSEIQSYKFNQKTLLQEHGLNIQRSIYDFNNSKSNIFNFPKSFNFDSYLFDKNNNLIYSTSKNNLDLKNKISIQYTLSENRLNANSLIITKILDFKEIYLKISVLTLSIGLFIFISAYIILKQTITPYKKANKYLDTFFNDAMHEIKTPLGIIQLNLELLEEKQKSTELTRSLNAVKSLLLTYEDIEYLMKQKRVQYTKEELNLTYFLKQRISIFESLAHSKNIIIEKEIDNEILLSINRIEIQRVIDNTISNAIKYSNESSKIRISLKKIENKLILSIEDYGKGIKDTVKIFDRYFREEKIQGGFGIGLNIVKNICKKNSINITVESSIGKGSKFTYTFS